MKSIHHSFCLRRLLLAAGIAWIGTSSFPLPHLSAQAVNGNLDVSGELDVHGNSFSLGTWTDNASNYGIISTYAEDAASHGATFTLTSSRSKSNWLWQKHVAGTGTGQIAQMGLSDGNALILYDLATPQNAGIVLDPVNTSSFNTSVVMNGPNNRMPNQMPSNDSTSVLTVGLADARYAVHNVGNSLSLGVSASASGDSSSAIGHGAVASGANSTALGYGASASAPNSTALGMYAYATDSDSTALGYGSVADGWRSMALGINSEANGFNSMVVGNTSSAGGSSASAIGPSSTADGDASMALGGASVSAGAASSALGFASHAMGNYSMTLGIYSLANASESSALGGGSVAGGIDSLSLGQNSGTSTWAAEALGFYAAADGQASLALGSWSHASGDFATALSSSSVASGAYSVAAGRTVATSAYQFAVGRHGLPGGDATNWVATDDLFTVGNGADATHPSNAFSVKKNGDATVNRNLVVNGAIIVPPQGDLSMGEFTAQPSPTP